MAVQAGNSANAGFRALFAAWIYASAPRRFENNAVNVAGLVVGAMAATTDGWQLRSLGEALGALGAKLPAAQAEAVALRLVETMAATTDGWQLSSLGKALGVLGEKLPAAQAEAVALRLVEAMAATTSWGQLSSLGKALGALGEQLPAAQAEAGALRLVETMAKLSDANAFVSLGQILGSIRLPPNPEKVDTAPDLLQAPMAHGETLEHLLRYYGLLAGLPENRKFETKDDFVAWARDHQAELNLTRGPRNPFR
jgi:hypothetical protein